MWTAVAELPVSPSYLSDTALEPELELIHQWKPTPESDTGCCALDLDGRPAGPSSPHCGRGPDCGRKKNGCPLLIYHVYYIKPMYPSGGHGRGSLLALQNRTAVRTSLALALARCRTGFSNRLGRY